MTSPAIATDHLRPAAHFTARETWLNDPNGLVHHEGVFHLFFQSNPYGSTWGNMSWGHATSRDLVTWEEHATAIPCIDGEMVFSGSAVVDHGNTAGFAAPGETALVAIYTAAAPATSDGPGTQAQALAYSVDAGATWTRYAGNPVLDIGSSEFRDPKVFRYGGEDGHWVMVVVEAVEHRVAIYTSDDLRSWVFASHFGPAHAVGGVWECPDLFPLQVDGEGRKWVMLVSLNPGGIAGGSGTQYFTGDFDGRTFRAERISTSADLADYDWLDHGPDFYAAVSFNDAPDDRRLIVGWASNWLYANETPTAPWRSPMSLARELSLARDVDGRLRLRQTPVLPEGADNVLVERVTASGDEETRIEVRSSAGDVFVIVADGERLRFDRSGAGDAGFHGSFTTAWSAPLIEPGTVDVQVIADGSVVEVFVGDGRLTATAQAFPTAGWERVEVIRTAR